MSTTKDITVREFIKEYLIDQIGEIKEKYPYFAFLLMSVGIEFLGQCVNEKPKFNQGNSNHNFDLGAQIPPLNNYSNNVLYNKLRCGLAHSMLVKGNLSLSDIEDGSSVSCNEFYQDFVEACKVVLAMKNLPKKNLNDIFFTITQTQNAVDGTLSSVTSVTQSNQSKTII